MTTLVTKTVETVSDAFFVAKAKRGDKNAFGQLYLKYLDGIYRYIFFRVGERKTDAEDLTETVFFNAWEHIGKYKTIEGNFRAWLYSIAHNTVIDYYRKEKYRIESLEEYIPDERGSVEDAILKKIETEEVIAALNLLTQEQKDVIILRFIEDLSPKEIAKILKKNEEAIRALQYRAIKELQKILNK